MAIMCQAIIQFAVAFGLFRNLYGIGGSKQNALDNIELLKKYKDLLDSGVITQEEFDAKKKELL